MENRTKPYQRPNERIEHIDPTRGHCISVSDKTYRMLHGAARDTGMSVHKLVIMACAREILAGGRRGT